MKQEVKSRHHYLEAIVCMNTVDCCIATLVSVAAIFCAKTLVLDSVAACIATLVVVAHALTVRT